MSEKKITWNDWLQKNQLSKEILDYFENLANREWSPTEKDQQAAWDLFTEMSSRISTQPLHYRSGDEETALTSVYNLFQITRDTIKKNGPECNHFSTFALHLINDHFRPLTARWHKKKVDGQLQHDDDRRDFRKELRDIQSVTSDYCKIFEQISYGSQYISIAVEPQGKFINSDALNEDIVFDKIYLNNQQNSKDILTTEKAAIQSRRPPTEEPVKNLAGLACSGGGIRSATFCLGIAQYLAKKGVLKDFDYLSTVSGGGYFGSFLSSFLNDPDTNNIGLGPNQLPFKENDKAESTPIRSLRNNSKYLLKDGVLGRLRIVGLLSLGILVNLLTLLFLMMLVVGAIKASIVFNFGLVDYLKILNPYLLYISAILILLLPFSYKNSCYKKKFIRSHEIAVILVTVLTLTLWITTQYVLPKVGWITDLATDNKLMATILLLSPFILGLAAFLSGLSTIPARLFLLLVGLSGPFLIFIGILIIENSIPDSSTALIALVISESILILWLWLININQITPHRYYRNRLVETYLLRNNKDKAVDPQKLSELRQNNPAAPYHLINAAVNLPKSNHSELRGRFSDFFVFSQAYCGSPLTGYCKTEELENKDCYIDLGTAMAISGAAASSYMGTVTIKGISFWLSLFNIRLGYWLPNPAKIKKVSSIFGQQPLLFWRELSGRINEKGDFINLSDGGHIENLGIYELLRRRCKYIVAIDGEADPDMTFGSLIKLLRYAQVDFGITIDIDLNDLKKNDLGYSKGHFSIGKIAYPDGALGHLLYIKSSLTGNENEYMLDYKKSNPSFPHETTADQFFSEEQFEAYRALGEHIGEDLFHSEVINGKNVTDVSSWISALTSNLMPKFR